jgi:hypothetical protein
MTEMPDDLSELHRKLRSVSFVPRASFEPELLGRLRRRDEPRGGYSRRARRHLLSAVALFGVAAAAGLALLVPGLRGDAVTVDRCCYDLDGGGEPDDGVLILAERDDRVQRLRVYEDLDGSRSYTAGDIVRLDRGKKLAILSAGGEGIVTIKRCCVDLDGGGPDDDGLLVIGVPPNRVLMAAIYETSPSARRRGSTDGWLLR